MTEQLMKVAIAGASGVVGHALLKEILNCPEIDEIYTVGRSLKAQ